MSTDEPKGIRESIRDATRPVYGPRAVRASTEPPLAAPSEPGKIPPPAERDGLPSTARANRRFRSSALVGFALVLALSATGLWWVATLAFG